MGTEWMDAEQLAEYRMTAEYAAEVRTPFEDTLEYDSMMYGDDYGVYDGGDIEADCDECGGTECFNYDELDSDTLDEIDNETWLCEECADGPSGPQPEDYVLTPSGYLGSQTSVSVAGNRFIGEYSSTEEALNIVQLDMADQQYWPTIWWVSDHGNCWPINLNGEEILTD